MGYRSNHYLNQGQDGYSISIGGIKVEAIDIYIYIYIEMHNGNVVDAVPHELIQKFERDWIMAWTAYYDIFLIEFCCSCWF